MSSSTNRLNDAIMALPSVIQDEVHAILAQRAVIPSATVGKWLELLGIEIGHLMIQLLPVAAAYARAPISGFYVGAVSLGMPTAGEGGPGTLYLGANMEFPNEALSFCIHGEQSATNNAWLHGETGLQALAINAAPCGYCRQFLYELTTATKGFDILLKATKDKGDYSYTSKPLSFYLPEAFGPQDLGNQGGLMEPENHTLTISHGDDTAMAALSAANACYSPYTKDYCGVALKDSAGVIYSGRYAENAAYNPSLSPMESALGFMNMTMPCQSPLIISEAVLVEQPSNISQRSATDAVLQSVAPAVSLQYIQSA